MAGDGRRNKSNSDKERGRAENNEDEDMDFDLDDDNDDNAPSGANDALLIEDILGPSSILCWADFAHSLVSLTQEELELMPQRLWSA
jgi:hypothetical protein